jgi:hypothetical protein
LEGVSSRAALDWALLGLDGGPVVHDDVGGLRILAEQLVDQR